MNNMKKLPIIILCILSLYSCSSIEQITIEHMVPGEINFPETLRRVAVVNNIPSNANAVSEEAQANKLQMSRNSFALEGDNKLMIETLAQSLAETHYFDEVVICDSALREKDIFNRESTLSKREITELVNELDVDFLIAAEKLSLTATSSLNFVQEWGAYISTIDVNIAPSFNIYLPSKQGPLFTINAKDSIFWEKVGATEGYVKANQISEKTAIKEASQLAGTLPMTYILPHWKSADRYIYVGGTMHMRDAAIYLKENNWDAAYKLWEEAYQKTKKKKQQMRIANNIAVYFEMKDDIDESLVWAEKAQKAAYVIDKIEERDLKQTSFYSISNFVNTSRYVEELKKRKVDLPILNIQMRRIHEVF